MSLRHMICKVCSVLRISGWLLTLTYDIARQQASENEEWQLCALILPNP